MAETAEELSPLAAYEELMRFAKLRGESALRLAMHAAVPQGIQPELLHLLRRNFVPEAAGYPALEADILFSPLCEELGRGYFKFDPQVRALLLENLAANYADEPEPRIEKVADFLLAYVDHYDRLASGSQDQLWRDYLEMQRWVAFAFADPSAAAQQLAAALENASSTSDIVARVQLGGLASALAAPLSNFPRLLNYAAGVQALELGDRERAREFFDTLQDDELKIGNTTLRSTSQILDEWHARHPEYFGATEESEKRETSADVSDSMEGLLSEEVSVRLESAKLLGETQPASDEAVRRLIDRLEDPEVAVRRACVLALANIQTEDAVVGLARAVADLDREVGHTAAEALRSLSRRPVLVLGALGRRGAIRVSIDRALLRWNYLSVAIWRPIGSKSRLIEIAQDVDFVIVDLTDASIDRSDLQMFLQLSIPVQLIMRRQSPQAGLFKDLQRYPSLMRLVTYDDTADLEGSMEKIIIPSIQSWLKTRPEPPQTELRKREFEYDVFISYAHSDNQRRTADAPSLIDKFVERLSSRLAELIGETPNMFRDTQLATAGRFPDRIREAIDRSTVFVIVITDAYLNSEYCKSELEAIHAAELKSDLSERAGNRIFKAFLRPFPSEQLPPTLRGSMGRHNVLDDLYERPDLQLDTNRSVERLDELASDIARVLQVLRRTRPATLSPLQRTVYLAETTRELRDERDRLKRSLEQQGYLVLPDRELPITATRFKNTVQDYLRRSNISIHLLGQKYGSYPDGGNRSISELQFQFAGERASDPAFSRIIWTRSDAKPESARQKRLFDVAVAESRQVDILRTPLAEVEAAVLDRLERLAVSAQTDEDIQTQVPKERMPERWPVRTGTDQDVSKVNPKPVLTTVQQLIDQKRPTDMPPMIGAGSKYHSQRSVPVETTVWSVDAGLLAFRLNQRESYRLVLEGGDDVRILAEVPDHDSLASDSRWLESFASVRNKLEERLSASTSFSYLSPVTPVRVTGVGFFSGFHGKRFAAPNGIELQPILDIEWLPELPERPRPTKQAYKKSVRKKASVVKLSSKRAKAVSSRKTESVSSSKSAPMKTKARSAKKRTSKKNTKKR
jgi:hypothetical protein